MKTDVILVTAGRTEAALREAEKVAAYKGLTGKNALHLRLLTEEMMGLMRSLTGETEARFWIEEEGGEYRLHLVTSTRMDSGKREQLLSVSTGKKNEAARGLMGTLRDFFDRSADTDVAAAVSPILSLGVMDSPMMDWEWSLVRMNGALAARAAEKGSAEREAWDELEKSVVAHVADDVRVSIRGQTVEMTLIKKMAEE